MTGRKNILLISLDDAFAYWKYRSVFGAELKTPNLDRICDVSTAFHNAYCQVPVCGPSRASFMSALTPHQLGIFDNYTNVFDVLRPEQMWPFRLKQDGYYCSNGGKVHHGYTPRPPEIHNVLYSHPAEAFNIGPGPNVEVARFGGLMRGQGTIDPAFDDRYYDAQSAASAVRFLNTYDRPEPFYREVGFYHPHSPYKTPLRFKEMYDETEFLQPEAWARRNDKNDYAEWYMQENMDNTNKVLWRRSVRNYFSALSHVDEHLGKVWDALKGSAYADNTIVVIVADHGYHPGDKNRFRKLTLWEEACGVPLIIHDPNQNQGRVVTDPVALLDVGPTVLDYADCAPLRDCAGQSLRQQVNGETVAGRAVPSFLYGSVSIRKGDYRYIYFQDGTCQLFHLGDDPWQLRDIAQSDPIRDQMHAALVETSRLYGLEIIGQKGDAPRPNAYATLSDGAHAPDRVTGAGVISINSVASEDSSPGFRRNFSTLRQDGTVKLPDSLRAIYMAADYRIGIDSFGIKGNDRGNLFNFVANHNRFLIDVDCGMGDDVILGRGDSLKLRLNAGSNTVQTGVSGATVFGGSGSDRIATANGVNRIEGGTGRCDITTGQGDDTVITAQEHTRVECIGGSTRVIVDQGCAEIMIRGGEVTLVFRRTGLPHVVRGFREGNLDLADWAVLGAPTFADDAEGGTILTAGSERIHFIGCARAVVEQSVTFEMS